MRGRGLRGPAFGGTEYVQIIDFADQIDTHRELRDRMMDYVREQRFGDELDRRRRLWARVEALEQVMPARDFYTLDVDEAVYRVFTKGGRLRKRTRAVQNLSAAVIRGIESNTSPVRPGHEIYYYTPTQSLDLDVITAYLREFDPDTDYTT